MTKIQKTEKELAGASYIIGFFSELEALLSYTTSYVNNVVRFKIKYGQINDKTEFEDADKIFINIIENFKGSAFRCYVKFTALKKKIKEFKALDEPDKKDKEFKTIKDFYLKIREAPIPLVDDAEAYVLRLNDLFVEAIDVLATAQGVYTRIAGGQPDGND